MRHNLILTFSGKKSKGGIMGICTTEKEQKKEAKEVSRRLLTPGEVLLANSVFMSRIPYHKVWVYCRSYLPLGLQPQDTAMTPNGNIYFRRRLYRQDFSQATDDFQHLFIHEMSHIWQRERGMNVLGRGLVSVMVSYRYKLDGRVLSEYPMEQQAQIIADNFILQTHGYSRWVFLRETGDVTYDGNLSESLIKQLYKHALRGFPS
jgi:hypothetical protein